MGRKEHLKGWSAWMNSLEFVQWSVRSHMVYKQNEGMQRGADWVRVAENSCEATAVPRDGDLSKSITKTSRMDHEWPLNPCSAGAVVKTTGPTSRHRHISYNGLQF